ncbi:MgtC/SapB family protein [Clostridium felsineum]|uniref:Protein SapB n=1 Tax=Clostridium felsineum TaxID=36839 RepID=A0A1S8L1C4_9CLOT|nr:MgtC/SapB family protein [Clostridium felsineum]MCR3760505.1 MgtC/SapB family protein [Clostridium felsineum]URZ02888.1 Protein SapB [Clostridium felsineum]URZ08775.1 Protein SapB [Clostridium felsineum]URZ09403.1 Protein SapB [Clostridium felsineum]URZ14242.1 Protein SapB [Clostridium felsineum DSM 794]
MFSYNTELTYFIRILIAGVCGGLIGYERKNRMKEAGIRTHFIVCLSSALIMIVSKYGFQDQVGVLNISIDPSRVAAQVVSGIGFLGAGMIFMRRQSVKGLTTAAGVWATAGVGLAIGSGLYIIGLLSSFIILLGQTFLHSNFSWLSTPKTEELSIKVLNEPDVISKLRNIFDQNDIFILSFKIKNTTEGNCEKQKLITMNLILKVPYSYDTSDFLLLIQDYPFIKCIEF